MKSRVSNIGIILLILSFFTAIVAKADMMRVDSSVVFDSIYSDSIGGLKADAIGIYIEEIASGNVVLDVNGEVPMIPASITKVITAASLFSTGDVAQRYHTDVYCEGVVADSLLHGDIVLVGDGDPTLESVHFRDYCGLADSIVIALERIGITGITGDIRIERPDWIGYTQPRGWETADFTWPYGAGYFPVNFADNRMVVTIRRGEEPECNPRSPGATFERIQGKNSRVERKRDSAEYTFTHSGKKNFSTTIANGAPESSLIYSIKESLEKAGICVDESERTNNIRNRTLLLRHKSPTIGEIMESTLMRSDNMMAEALLRHLADGQSREQALIYQKDTWTKRGVDFCDIVIEDGSGLSRTNMITPYFMADILAWMVENSDNFMTFCNYLPLSGRSGTLKSFLKDTNLEGRLRAKTGSMNGVQCYAGYATDAIGVPTHIVVIMVNGFHCARSVLKKHLERVLIEKIQ